MGSWVMAMDNIFQPYKVGPQAIAKLVYNFNNYGP